jgi:hypothetical protein
MNFDVDALQTQIPYYLTAAPRQKELVADLQALSEGARTGYFIQKGYDPHVDETLQGDGHRGFQVYSFETSATRPVRGIVLSNSCDVAAENERAMPSKITFAPLIKLSKLEERFNQRIANKQQISDRLTAIRKQSVTNVFYLPPDGVLEEEYVALLDDVHSMPLHALQPDKVFTLSMAGFYLFIFKLSVHFCRLHEQVDRRPRAAA